MRRNTTKLQFPDPKQIQMLTDQSNDALRVTAETGKITVLLFFFFYPDSSRKIDAFSGVSSFFILQD